MPDFSLVETWPQAIVALGVILLLALQQWLNAWRAGKRQEEVLATLTKNNGGDSVRDQFDKLSCLVGNVDNKVDGLRRDFDAHTRNSAHTVSELTARMRRVEKRGWWPF